MLPSAALTLASAFALGTPSVASLADLSLGALRAPRRPDLALHAVNRGRAPRAPGPLGLDAGGRADRSAPVCSGDLCQPAVAVPGFEPSYGRAHRSEAFVALLTRAHVEPLATLAWALVSTGLRLDWSPPSFDGPNAGARGWGSVTVRLRLRLDANQRIVIPPRPR